MLPPFECTTAEVSTAPAQSTTAATMLGGKMHVGLQLRFVSRTQVRAVGQ